LKYIGSEINKKQVLIWHKSASQSNARKNI